METSVNNGAIVIYKQKSIPSLLKFFSIPIIKDRHEVLFNEQKHTIFIIEYPVISNNIKNKRINKILSNILLENKISYTVEKHIDENSEYSTDKNNIIGEIRAIKIFSAVCKLSLMVKKNYLVGNIGFIMPIDDMWLIDIFSDEASNLMIYESNNLDTKTKDKIYTDYMKKKGISIVFSKELDKIINNSDVLLVDEIIDISEYNNELKKKILLGKNKADGEFNKIEDVLMWNDYIEDLSTNNNITYMNNELLTLLRYFYQEMTYMDFIAQFKHIYLFNNKDKWDILYNIR